MKDYCEKTSDRSGTHRATTEQAQTLIAAVATRDQVSAWKKGTASEAAVANNAKKSLEII